MPDASNIPDFFPSKIENNENKTHNPTYSILSYTNNFDLSAAIEYSKKVQIDNLFLIFSGQQSLSLKSDYYGDLLMCHKLTGGDRISDCFGNWNGTYRIHTSAQDKYKSIASQLFDRYQENSLIIDVLNTKYNWLNTIAANDLILNNFVNTIMNFYHQLNNMNNIKFFIFGFSRGGIFALKFTQHLVHNNLKEKINIVVTIDPVKNPTEKCIQYAMKAKDFSIRKDSWVLSSTFLACYYDFFPILESEPDITYYNVFQRQALSRIQDQIEKIPIGCCVNNAISPIDCEIPKWENAYTNNSNIIAIPDRLKSNVDQYDQQIFEHTPDMLNKYGEWIIDLTEKHLLC